MVAPKEAIVIDAGAIGAPNKVLVNLALAIVLKPHPLEYFKVMLSPTPAAALLLNVAVKILEVRLPESTTALDPKVPMKAQT